MAQSAEQAAAFFQQLRLERDHQLPGRYYTDLDPSWNCPYVPHCGLIAAIAARLRMGIPPSQDVAAIRHPNRQHLFHDHILPRR